MFLLPGLVFRTSGRVSLCVPFALLVAVAAAADAAGAVAAAVVVVVSLEPSASGPGPTAAAAAAPCLKSLAPAAALSDPRDSPRLFVLSLLNLIKFFK